jgi:predicted nucleic acid-binding protein
VILIDTGPVVAFFDRDDRYHAVCVDVLKKIREPLVTTWPVITECFYLLNFSWEAQQDLWTFLQRGGVEVHAPATGRYPRCRDLMEKYRDLPMDLADASLVSLAEELRISRIFTLDHKDFSIYRSGRREVFHLLPSKLLD